MANISSYKTCLILLDLPSSLFCGIDLLSFTTSKNFRGVKNLPPGWHFVFTGASSELSIRHGVWFHVRDGDGSSPEVTVMRWDLQQEELKPVTEGEEMRKCRANLGSIWHHGLTPYRQTSTTNTATAKHGDDIFEEKGDWCELTYGISKDVLSRILGSAHRDSWSLTSASCAARDDDQIPGLTTNEKNEFKEKDLNFLPVDLKKTWREGAIGRERTEAAQDRSWALGQLTKDHCQHVSEVIGEINLCFLMVLTLNNYSCMEQWKRLLTLVLTCSEAIVRQPTFFVQFFACLQRQLEHCEDADGGLFDLTDESGNLLKVLLTRFRQDLNDPTLEAKTSVLNALSKIEEYMRSTYGWTLNETLLRHGLLELEDGEQVDMKYLADVEDDDDYGPTLVDLTPEQLNELYGSEGHKSQFTHNSKNLQRNVAPGDEDDTILSP